MDAIWPFPTHLNCFGFPFGDGFGLITSKTGFGSCFTNCQAILIKIISINNGSKLS